MKLQKFYFKLLPLKLIFLFCFMQLNYYSQQNSEQFKPYHIKEENKKRIEQIQEDFKKLSESSKYTDTISKNIFKRNILSLSDVIIMSDTTGFILKDDPISLYLQEIVQKIISGNDILKNTNFKVYTAQNNDVNAANYGKGVVFVNLGVIYRSNNEDQLAFVIAHEMGHNYLNHVVNGIKKEIEIFNNSEVQKEQLKLSKEKFNRYKRNIEILKKHLIKYKTNSREFELQADSIGLVFLKNAGYDPIQGYRQLLMLDTCDKFYFTKKIPYENYFNYDDLKFKKDWLINEEAIDIGNNLEGLSLPDSLKSHPDAKIRAALLLSYTKSFKRNGPSKIKSEFQTFKTMAIYEALEKYITENNYSLSLYNSLQLLNESPNEQFLILNITILAKNNIFLNEINCFILEIINVYIYMNYFFSQNFSLKFNYID